MDCRDEILNAVNHIIKANGVNEFTIIEVIDYMNAHRTSYSESTIRTHITSKLCVNAPANHATRFPDFERIGRGIYRKL